MPLIGRAPYLKPRSRGQVLIAAGGGAATLIAFHKTARSANSQSIGNGGGLSQNIQLNVMAPHAPEANSVILGVRSASIPQEEFDGCFDMTAST